MTFANAYDAELAARLSRALAPAITVGAPLGRGGFALVYAGVDVTLRRDVAVKVLRPELAVDEVMRTRFRREAEAVARLRHPHIVPIYSVGELDGIVWYVMPLLAGPSLKVHLERSGRLPIPDVRRIIGETADALATAHRAGIVHRDIKPDNMLLDGPDARVLVTDFGIAKVLHGRADGQTLTQTGVVIGTPHYMSPEQAAGEPTDARSDIYSLGVVAYQLLTGELPFEAATVAALLVKQLQDHAPNVLRRRPDCPSDLAAAVSRCLAKDQAQRWQSADDLRQAVAAPVTAETVAARRSAGGARMSRLASPAQLFRTSMFVSLATVGALVLIDAIRGQLLLAPLAILVAAFILALQYGRLWTVGYEWRDIWRRDAAGSHSPVPLDSAEFGPHEGAIQQARAERAAIRVQLERMPRATRPRFEAAVRAADALLGQAGALGRQLYGLERQVDPGPEEIERRLAATESEPSSPGRAQRVAVLERRRDAVRGLVRRRDELAATLTTTLTALARLRSAVEQEPDRIDEALRVASSCLESAQPT